MAKMFYLHHIHEQGMHELYFLNDELGRSFLSGAVVHCKQHQTIHVAVFSVHTSWLFGSYKKSLCLRCSFNLIIKPYSL